MVIISVHQYVDKDWRFLGEIHQPTMSVAKSLLHEFQERLLDPKLVYFPIRQHTDGLLVINLKLGAVKFNIQWLKEKLGYRQRERW